MNRIILAALVVLSLPTLAFAQSSLSARQVDVSGTPLTTVLSSKLTASSNLSDLASPSVARGNLGLGSAATQPTSAFDAAGAAVAIQAGLLQKSSNLSDLVSPAAARSNLGLATVAATGAWSDITGKCTTLSGCGITDGATTSALAGKAATTTTISVGAGLSGGGDLSANRTVSLGASLAALAGITPGAAGEALLAQTTPAAAVSYLGALPTTGGTLSGALNGTTISLSGALQGNTTVTWSGSGQTSPATSSLYLAQTINGSSTITSGASLWANILQIEDRFAAGPGTYAMDGLYIQDHVGPSATGNRNAFHASVIADTAQSNPLGSSYPDFVGVFETAVISANMGGTGNTFSTVAGSAYAQNPNVICDTGATFIYLCNIAEFDSTFRGSGAEHFGASFILSATSTAQGAQDDTALEFLNQSGAVGWKNIFQLNFSAGATSNWPLDPTYGQIMSIAGAGGTALNGFNLRGAHFTGCAFDSTGYCLDGSGDLSISGTYTEDLNATTLPAAPAGTTWLLASADGQTNRMTLQSFGGAPAITCERADGTNASKTAVQTNDSLCSMGAIAWNGGAYSAGAAGSISILAGTNWTTSNQNTFIVGTTTLPGQTTAGTRFIVDPVTGAFDINTSYTACTGCMLNVTGNGYFSGIVHVGASTIAGLSTADPSPTVGDTAVVTNATGCTAGSTPSSGGSTACHVFYTGGAWVVGKNMRPANDNSAPAIRTA